MHYTISWESNLQTKLLLRSHIEMVLVPILILLPLHNLCRIISSHHTYVPLIRKDLLMTVVEFLIACVN
jgi:hypothetical protein